MHARELYELLRDRLEVFLADEKQEDFVGTDGEESFGYIFRDLARIVVVLYRPDWGTTTFTRAEESAIRQRAYDEGYGFSVWVPMDATKSIPPYLPPQYIWFDFEQYGVKGLASVIEELVRQSGRDVRPETTADRLRRIKRKIDLEKERQVFEGSQDGVEFVSDANRRLEEVLSSQAKKYEEISPDIRFTLNRDGNSLVVASSPYKCNFRLYRDAINTISDARLAADLMLYSGQRHHEKWRCVCQNEFKPTLDENGNPSWQHKNGECYSLESAVAHVLDDMAEKVYAEVERRIAKGSYRGLTRGVSQGGLKA